MGECRRVHVVCVGCGRVLLDTHIHEGNRTDISVVCKQCGGTMRTQFAWRGGAIDTEDALARENAQLLADLAAMQRELAASKADNEQLRAVLRDLEWSDINDYDGRSFCPLCGWPQKSGHAPLCKLGAVLAEEQ